MKRINILHLIMILAVGGFVVFGAGCSEDNPVNAGNPPKIDVLQASQQNGDQSDVIEEMVFAGQEVTLSCDANDPDQDNLAFSWWANTGSFDRIDSCCVTWTAPDSTASVLITVTVSDSRYAVSDTVLFSVVTPDLVALVSPAQDAIMDNGCYQGEDGIAWDFCWHAYEGASKYHLYVKGANATYPYIDNSNMTDTTYHSVCQGCYIGGMNIPDWTWKVRAMVDGSWTEWSEERSFDVEPLNTDCENIDPDPEGVELFIPENGAILDNGCTNGEDGEIWDFEWSLVPGASRYHLYIHHTGSHYPLVNTQYVYDTTYHREGSGYIVDCNRFDWRWKVRAMVDGNWTEWSEERSFDVEPLNTDCTEPAEKILVDASKDGGGWWFPQSPSDGFDPDSPHQGKALADYLRGLGYQVDELPRGAVITDSLLSCYDRVIRASKYFPYTESELIAYDNFLSRSTSLILISEYLRPSQTDVLAERLGITFAGITRGKVDTFADHVITQNAVPFYYNAGSAVMNAAENQNIEVLGWMEDGAYLDLNNNDTQDLGEPTGMPVMGILHHPHARIFFIGDINGLEGMPQPLVSNIFEWAFQ